MFTSKNKSTNSVISAFESLKTTTKKNSENQSKAYLNLQDWSTSSANNLAIQDVSCKLMTLFSKLDNEINVERINAISSICDLFKKLKEYDTKISKLNDDIANAEKRQRKREEELEKCPASKNIRDCEVRLYRAKVEKEKLQLEHYNLCTEIEAAKTILFKTSFTRLSQSLIKYNKAENFVLNAMNDLLLQIPDIDADIKETRYTNNESTNDILNETLCSINQLNSSIPTTTAHQSMSNLCKHKKIKSKRISCPATLVSSLRSQRKSSIFPDITELTLQTKNEIESTIYKVKPSAPPQSDIESKSSSVSRNYSLRSSEKSK